jgi:hypothetical protein
MIMTNYIAGDEWEVKSLHRADNHVTRTAQRQASYTTWMDDYCSHYDWGNVLFIQYQLDTQQYNIKYT